jgi:DNA-binding NarL/FixJ family response regulator
VAGLREKDLDISVAIVEDDPGIRTSLGSLIRAAPGFKLVGAYGSSAEALAQLSQASPEVVLMDINLPGLSGIECVRRLKPLHPEVQFVMLTVYEDNESLFDSLKAGASGYLLKRAASKKLLSAIREVRAGGSPMTPQMARRVVQFFHPAAGPAPAVTSSLTEGERKVLDEFARGFSYKETADRLGVTVHTINSYVRVIYDKLHVHSRTEAVLKHVRGG